MPRCRTGASKENENLGIHRNERKVSRKEKIDYLNLKKEFMSFKRMNQEQNFRFEQKIQEIMSLKNDILKLKAELGNSDMKCRKD